MRLRVRTILTAAFCASVATGSPAQERDRLPDFATCMDIEIARFERALTWLHRREGGAEEFSIAGVQGVYYCGSVGIVSCDRSEAPIPCQKQLVDRQDNLSVAVLNHLPKPDAVAFDTEAWNGHWAVPFYARAFALARGTSAGPDCAGSTEVLQVWCEAREANTRLQNAVLAWEVARYLDLVAPAVEIGWVNPPPPVRPRLRPEQ